MSEPSSAEKPRAYAPPGGGHKIQIGRVQIAVNVFVQAIAMLLLVFLANYLSFRHHKSIDWSSSGRFTLSPQTLAVLKQFQEPCKAIVYFYSEGPVRDDTVSMLREYQSQSNHKLSLEIVNPGVSPSRAKELQNKYKFGGLEDIIILDYKEKSKWVEAKDFAEVVALPKEKQDPNKGETMRIKSYKGEQYVTAALLELAEEKQSKIYLVSGHGEIDLAGSDFKVAQHYLQRQNFKLETLLLAGADKIPADAAALLIAGPTQDFSDRDIKLLDEYWRQNGRLFIALGSVAPAERLGRWLADRGIMLHHDEIIRVSRGLLADGTEKYQIQTAAGVFLPGPITHDLAGKAMELPRDTQSLEPVEAMVKTGQITVTKLMESPKGWWGETEPVTEKTVPRYDPGKDYPKKDPGPLALAIALEKGAARDPQVKLQTPRLVLVGSGDFLGDDILQVAPLGKDLLVNSMNWLLSRDTLIELPAKEKPMNDVDLTNEQISQLGWTLILGLPSAFGLFGLYFIWWRHGRNLLTLTVVMVAIGLVLWGSVEGFRRWAASAPEQSESAEDSSPLP